MVLVVTGIAAYVIRQRPNREANIARADQLRTQAATQAQSTLASHAGPGRGRGRGRGPRRNAARPRSAHRPRPREARVAAAQAEAQHEGQVRAADRLDPRVDHRSDDYSPQVGGTVDQEAHAARRGKTSEQPTGRWPRELTAASGGDQPRVPDHPLSEATADDPRAKNTDIEPTSPSEAPWPSTKDRILDCRTQLIPRRTRGAQEMPGKPIEQTDGGGGWFTRKENTRTPTWHRDRSPPDQTRAQPVWTRLPRPSPLAS